MYLPPPLQDLDLFAFSVRVVLLLPAVVLSCRSIFFADAQATHSSQPNPLSATLNEGSSMPTGAIAAGGSRMYAPVPQDALQHESKEKLIAYESETYQGHPSLRRLPSKSKKRIDPRRLRVYIDRCYPEWRNALFGWCVQRLLSCILLMDGLRFWIGCEGVFSHLICNLSGTPGMASASVVFGANRTTRFRIVRNRIKLFELWTGGVRLYPWNGKKAAR